MQSSTLRQSTVYPGLRGLNGPPPSGQRRRAFGSIRDAKHRFYDPESPIITLESSPNYRRLFAETGSLVTVSSSGESVQTGVRATGGRPRMPLRGRRAASAPRISPGHWDDRRMFPKSEWGMFPKRMLHVPASRRSLRLPDARSRHWNETSLPVRQIIAVAAVNLLCRT